MAPIFKDIQQNAIVPVTQEKIDLQVGLDRAGASLKKFMVGQTKKKDLELMLSLAHQQWPKELKDMPLTVAIPSFVLSELKVAFEIGFLIYLPFVLIDMVVATVLLTMGMLMLPPVVISLPFKLMLFVLVDGWDLVIGSLVRSFS